MKVIVFAHRLELGGTQTNAIELASAVGERFGHDVVLFAAPGPAAGLAAARGVRLVEAPGARRHPSYATVRALRDVVAAESPDLLHVWDWPQCLDAFFGVHLTSGLPLLCTVMSMSVSRFLPRTMPVTLGCPQLEDRARRMRSGPVSLLEPPVDLEANRAGAVDSFPFRSKYGLDDETLHIVVVSRLVSWMKLEGLRRAIDAIERLAARRAVRLVIVGEGPAGPELRRRAAEVNDRHRRRVVVLTGGLLDPRPAYAMADVVVGMGGSALRAMAFARPLVVIGEQGFSALLTPATAPLFLRQGFYGIGGGDLSPEPLTAQLGALLDDQALRRELGQFGRELVSARYGLVAAAGRLEVLYRQTAVLRTPPSRRCTEAIRTVALRTGARMIPPGMRGRIRDPVAA